MWELRTPTRVAFNLVNRTIVIRSSGSSDSPTVLTTPATFKGST